MAKKKEKPYWEMSLEELREATKEFDHPISLRKSRPLTKSQRQKFERMRAGGVRSVFVKRENRTHTVKVDIDSDLLQRSNEYASAHKMSLSEVISKSLRSIMSFVE